MTHSERAYAGPDMFGRTYKAEPCLHVAAFDEHQRLQRIRRMGREAVNRRKWGRR